MVHTVRGVPVVLSNDVSCNSCIQIYPQGFPHQIGSALVAGKWLYVKGWSPPSSQAVRTALHVLQCTALLTECMCCILGMAGQGIALVTKKGTLLLFPGLTRTVDICWKSVHCLPDLVGLPRKTAIDESAQQYAPKGFSGQQAQLSGQVFQLLS